MSLREARFFTGTSESPSNRDGFFRPPFGYEWSRAPDGARKRHPAPPLPQCHAGSATGGMGEIFRAEDEVLGRTVAIKVLAERYSRDESLRARFTREALAAARLSGEPSTVTIFDVGEWRGRPFIVMEHLEGGSLEDRLRARAAVGRRGARLARAGGGRARRSAPERASCTAT